MRRTRPAAAVPCPPAPPRPARARARRPPRCLRLPVEAVLTPAGVVHVASRFGAATAAWIVEELIAWMDAEDGDPDVEPDPDFEPDEGG